MQVQAWGVEKESMVVPLGCSTGLTLESEAIQLDNLPDGAEYDADARALDGRATVKRVLDPHDPKS